MRSTRLYVSFAALVFIVSFVYCYYVCNNVSPQETQVTTDKSSVVLGNGPEQNMVIDQYDESDESDESGGCDAGEVDAGEDQ